MCDEAVDGCLAALKFISDSFVTIKPIKRLFTVLHADGSLLFFNEDSGNVTFCCNEMGIFGVNFNNIYLDNKFDEDDPNTFIFVRLLDWHIRFKSYKAIEKDK